MSDLPSKVNMSEFRNNLPAYLDAVEAGKTITIMRRGKPSATLKKVATLVEPLNIDKLRLFRESLGVKIKAKLIEDMRKEERY